MIVQIEMKRPPFAITTGDEEEAKREKGASSLCTEEHAEGLTVRVRVQCSFLLCSSTQCHSACVCMGFLVVAFHFQVHLTPE
jgi:hypothetical protein